MTTVTFHNHDSQLSTLWGQESGGVGGVNGMANLLNIPPRQLHGIVPLGLVVRKVSGLAADVYLGSLHCKNTLGQDMVEVNG